MTQNNSAGLYSILSVLADNKQSRPLYHFSNVDHEAAEFFGKFAAHVGANPSDVSIYGANDGVALEISRRAADYLVSGLYPAMPRLKKGRAPSGKLALNRSNAIRGGRYAMDSVADGNQKGGQVYRLAFIAARRAVKTVVNKECTPRLLDIQRQFAHFDKDARDIRGTLSDAFDLVQTAAVSILDTIPENWKLTSDAWAVYVSACLARREEFDGMPTQAAKTWGAALRAARNLIANHSANKGRKVVRVVRDVQEQPVTITTADGETTVYRPTGNDGKPRRVTLDSCTGYAVETLSLSPIEGNPEQYAAYLEKRKDGGAAAELEESFTGVAFVQACREAGLKDDSKEIAKLRLLGYNQTDIAAAVGISQQTVSRRLEKIANALAKTPTYRDTDAERRVLGMPIQYPYVKPAEAAIIPEYAIIPQYDETDSERAARLYLDCVKMW
ncbi:XRE family transcriptional regulator [Butyricicoccus sp. 1XD8-22]|nr:XRE family transcriptional regulator [Butyricicoccus sp. 1XD8-22]